MNRNSDNSSSKRGSRRVVLAVSGRSFDVSRENLNARFWAKAVTQVRSTLTLFVRSDLGYYRYVCVT